MKKEMIKKILIGSIVIFVIGSLVGTLVYVFPQRGKKTTNIPTVVQTAMDYINQILKEQGQSVVLTSWEEKSGFFILNLKIGETPYQSFVTKDGKYLFPYAIDLNQVASQQESQKSNPENQVSDIEKREKPDVKLFVMSYCPYGLQMEKAILPVWEIFKDKADIGIYFVDYLMHGRQEMEENLRQYCIQKEEKEKFLAYLNCFVKDGKFENCLKEAKINEQKLKSCEETADKEFKISESFNESGYPPFNVHQELNEKYGIRGSPTLVINDKVVNIQRSPEKVKEAICNSFLVPPPECEQSFSSTPTSPGFGWGEGSTSGGGCGQ